MTVATATVRRGGAVLEVAAEDLVPGDVVLPEAGSVPAEGRLPEEVALEAPAGCERQAAGRGRRDAGQHFARRFHAPA